MNETTFAVLRQPNGKYILTPLVDLPQPIAENQGLIGTVKAVPAKEFPIAPSEPYIHAGKVFHAPSGSTYKVTDLCGGVQAEMDNLKAQLLRVSKMLAEKALMNLKLPVGDGAVNYALEYNLYAALKKVFTK